jgi:conjugative relaxase-like TrwC/TraI family protein
VTTLKGASAGQYYVEELPRYYVEAGEPPGRWMGRGAVASGLEGDVDPDAFIAVMAGLDPSDSHTRGRRYGEDSVRGFDVTCSAPKSVSVLWAVAPKAIGDQVVAAHEAAVAAVVEFVDFHAVTRVSANGEVIVVDAEGITAAVFRQHTSRAGDPQLHSHVVIAAKVQGPGGRWLALDARGLKCDQRTLSAIYHAGLRSELTRRLGVAWENPVNGIAELGDVSQMVREVFSKRTEQSAKRLAVKLRRFWTDLGRHPTPTEYWRLEREAVVDSRPAKPKPEMPHILHEGWRAEIEAVGRDPWEVAREVVRDPVPGVLEPAGVGAMVDQAVSAVAEQQSTWRRNEVIRELAKALPTTVTYNASELRPWLEDLADHTIATRLVELAPELAPGTRTRSDGRPVTESVLDRRFTTEAILEQEERIVDIADRRMSHAGEPGAVDDAGLDPGQRDVARAVAGTAPLVIVVGPAGTGKTTALRPAVAALQHHGRDVVGLAPSATAAAVLAEETGVRADTVHKLLHDERTGRGSVLLHHTTVIVDEAGMLGTPQLAELLHLAELRRARVVLVGDPLQLSAVGRGGMFAHLVASHPTVELESVYRFTNEWERQASLDLRAGRPEAISAYAGHGRIHDGPGPVLEDAIVARWLELRGQGSVAVLASTNGTVHRLNEALQAERLAAGELRGPGLGLPSGQRIHVGDQVATRQNDRTLRTDRGAMVCNRARWTVEAVDPIGSVAVTSRDGRVTLPAEYVAEHLELAYAETVHAAQGRTVDHSLVLADGPVDGTTVYVALTRGRQTNNAYAVTDGTEPGTEALERAIAQVRADRPAVALEQVDGWSGAAREPDSLGITMGL